MIIRSDFFSKIRISLFHNKLSQSQVDGISAILDEWERQGLTDVRWLAYMLATTYHETAQTMQPIEEYGKGKGRKYGLKIKRSGIAYTTPDKIYYGRGLIQLTWYENYQQMGRLLGVALLDKPELACNMKIAIRIMFEGMMKGASSFGDFTGKCLEMYFNDHTDDPIHARKIINGLDCANLIADHHHKFLTAIS
jgi:putative chitinase